MSSYIYGGGGSSGGGGSATSATTTNEGIVYLATQTQVNAGTESSNYAIVPSTLESKLNTKLANTPLSTLSNVSSTSPTNNQVLTYDNTAGEWKPANPQGSGGDLLASNNLNDVQSFSSARTNLGLEIGLDVQAFDQDLSDIASISPAQNDILVRGSTSWEAQGGNVALTSIGAQPQSTRLDELSGLSPSSTDQTIVWSGSSWDLGPIVGTSANQLIKLNSSGKLPAVDGSLLTNLPSGGGSRPAITTTNNTAVDLSSNNPASSVLEIIYVLNGSSQQTITLHTAVGHEGLKYQFKRVGTANVVINTDSTLSPTQNIDSTNTFTLSTQYDSITIISDNANWLII